MNGIDKFISQLNRLLIFLGGLCLVFMIVLTCSNIVFRIFWEPIRGTFELMGFFGAIVIAFALGFTQKQKGHIAVDILVNKFSVRTKRALNTINSLICMLFFGVAAWQVAKKAATLLSSGEVTETLRIIYYPFTFCVAFGCGVLALVCLTEAIQAVLLKCGGSKE
jgi:TRAP-type C4-dicarboxylate transport system permease small subunit